MTMHSKWKSGLAVYGCGILYDLIYAVCLGFSGKPAVNGLLAIPMFNGETISLFMPFALDLYRRLSHLFCIDKLIGKTGHRFNQYESYSYLVVPLSALIFFIDIRPYFAFALAVLLVLMIIQLGLLWFSLSDEKRTKLANSEKTIAVLFLISGFSALIYQVVWQRILFTTFGVNSESVTVIVSIFMLGIGMGALLGGYLQTKFPNQLLKLFLLLEISIGSYGLVSLPLIQWAGDITTPESLVELCLRVYGILAIPTLLMGATLPILVAYLQNYLQNIGKTVGVLYAFNTFGSALAAFLTVELLFVLFGQQTTLIIAASCNFITACLIFRTSLRLNPQWSLHLEKVKHGKCPYKQLSYSLAFIILFAIGYISLSQEILWFRLLGFMSANKPQVFGLLLTAFLVGVSFGALNSQKKFESGGDSFRYLVRAVIFTAGNFYFAFPVIADTTMAYGKAAGTAMAYLFVAVVAYFSGGILPILIHAGVDKQSKNPAAQMSLLYFANILGSTLGPILTGFILLEYFSLELNVLILSGITLIVLLILLLCLPESPRFKLSIMAAVSLGGLSLLLFHPILYQDYLEKIHYASAQFQPFKHRIENRGGILAVEKGNSDIMYGNGIYDGRFNIDLVNNSNGIDRAYMIASLHRRPKKILEIGLSTGSWARIFADYEPLEQMTVIEINKGYPRLIENYPEIAGVLTHPKVKLVHDDGRRWLRHHPEQKFDMIVMNTTYYWRSNSTNLLSTEFLQLCKQHLNKNGVIYYNTTGSADIPYTAAHVFNHVAVYSTFVAASNAPFDMNTEEKKLNLLNFKTPSSNPTQYMKLIEHLASHRLPDMASELPNKKNLWLITDDNMATEYKVN